MPESFRELGRFLLIAGIALAAIGTLLMTMRRLPFRLGRLPGDIAYSGRHGTIYFPLATCVLLSVAFSLILWIAGLFRR
jgi:hypothetical protein